MRDIEGHARARRGLVEDHGERLAGERPLAGARRAVALLHGAACLDHPAQMLAREVDQIEEVADAGALIPPPPAFRLSAAPADRGAGAVDPRDRLGDLGFGDDQRRHQPHDIVAGGDR